jgi:hypothetical protein
MIRRVVPLLVLGAALLTTVACGQSGVAAPGASSEPAPYAAEVTGVRPGPAPTVLLIDVSLPAGGDGCARDLKAEVFDEEEGRVYVHVTFQSPGEEVAGGCPSQAPAVATLTTPEPLGTRVVIVNEHAWAPTGGAYRRCAEDVGCTPPADHCDPAWELAAFNGLDVPRHAARDFEHCDQSWLVMTVDLNSSACGAGRPECSVPPSVTRYFLRWHDGWEEFAQTKSGGCGVVRAAAPAFPQALCEHLRAPG